MNDSTCIFNGCGRPKLERDWCHKHYEYLRGRGDLPPKPCRGCGAPLPGPRHYCSDECKPKCSVEGCAEAVRTRTWCEFHFTRWKLTGDPSAAIKRGRYQAGQLCSFNECTNKARRAGLCASHYTQAYNGHELRPIIQKSKSNTCAFCGGPSGIVKGFRKYCSVNCQQMYYRHDGPLPDAWRCILCGESFAYVMEGRRRARATTRMCNSCRRNSAKHGYSAAQLAKRDGAECKLCGELIDMALVHPDLMRGSVDHIIPRSLGGSNEPDNVQLAHLLCNIKKNNRVEAPTAP